MQLEESKGGNGTRDDSTPMRLDECWRVERMSKMRRTRRSVRATGNNRDKFLPQTAPLHAALEGLDLFLNAPTLSSYRDPV